MSTKKAFVNGYTYTSIVFEEVQNTVVVQQQWALHGNQKVLNGNRH